MNDDLTRALELAFSGKAWHGPTLLGSVRGVTPAEAALVPRPLKHSIWHLVLHAAYWKYAACLRVLKAGVDVDGLCPEGESRPRFPRSPSNFPAPPTAPSDKAWRDDLRLLRRYHLSLVSAVEKLSEAQLDSIPAGGRTSTLRKVVIGVAAHDAYHTGQIQLLKRLIRK